MNHAPITIIAKTSFDCNFRCAYCYEGHQELHNRMSVSTASNLISKVAAHTSQAGTTASFVWHGGEPLLLGQQFYAQIVETQWAQGHQFRYNNMLQTNGLLLDKSFASFFAQNGFQVGVSLDGPAFLHDAQRPTKAGAPSFKAALGAFKLLKKQKNHPGAVAIFTRNTLNNLDAFYEFFRSNRLSVRVNPLLMIGSATDDAAKDLTVTPKEYGEALVYLFDRWIGEPKFTFSMDPFYNIVRSFMSGQVHTCSFAGQCHNFFKVFPNGDLYLCGKQESKKDRIGNINEDSFDKILAAPARTEYAQAKACVRELCGTCEHTDICNGGCTTSASLNRADGIGRDYYCESYKALFDRIKAVIPKAAIRQRDEKKVPEFCL